MLVANLARHDCRMHLQGVREIDDGYCRRLLTHGARLPDGTRNERLFSPLISLNLLRILTRPLDIAQCQVVHERSIAVNVHVPSNVCEFVHKAKPEVVDAVIAQGQTDRRRSVAQFEGSSVEVRFREVRNGDERNTMLAKELLAKRGPSSDQLSRASWRKNSSVTVPRSYGTAGRFSFASASTFQHQALRA